METLKFTFYKMEPNETLKINNEDGSVTSVFNKKWIVNYLVIKVFVLVEICCFQFEIGQYFQ